MMIKGGFFLEFRFFFLRCKILFMGSIVLYIKRICFSSKIKQTGTKNCNSLSRLARLERFAILPVSSCSHTACICHRQRRSASQLTARMLCFARTQLHATARGVGTGTSSDGNTKPRPDGWGLCWRHLLDSNQLHFKVLGAAAPRSHRNGKTVRRTVLPATVHSTHAGAARRIRHCIAAGRWCGPNI